MSSSPQAWNLTGHHGEHHECDGNLGTFFMKPSDTRSSCMSMLLLNLCGNPSVYHAGLCDCPDPLACLFSFLKVGDSPPPSSSSSSIDKASLCLSCLSCVYVLPFLQTPHTETLYRCTWSFSGISPAVCLASLTAQTVWKHRKPHRWFTLSAPAVCLNEPDSPRGRPLLGNLWLTITAQVIYNSPAIILQTQRSSYILFPCKPELLVS